MSCKRRGSDFHFKYAKAAVRGARGWLAPLSPARGRLSGPACAFGGRRACELSRRGCVTEAISAGGAT